MDKDIEAKMERALYHALKEKYEENRHRSLPYLRNYVREIRNGGAVGDGAIYGLIAAEREIRELEGD